MAKGWHLSIETKKRIGEAKRGTHHSFITRERISKALVGNKNGVGHCLSPEHKQKLIEINRGSVRSEESRQKMAKAKIGRHFSHTEETKEKIRIANTGKHPSKETLQKLSESHKWIKHSEEMRRKCSEAHKGEKAPAWKGGVTPENERIRKSIEYRLWREAVFARDNWNCQECGAKSGSGKAVYLHAHHIKPFAKHPELRFAIDNGVTLCRSCHKNKHFNKEAANG